MKIDKYKQEDGTYGFPCEDGIPINYRDAESAIMGLYDLDFCGCGNPLSALCFLKKHLDVIQELRSEERIKEWDAVLADNFISEGEAYFVWYYLDAKSITEHGGSVPGWLTEKGEDLLSDLTEFLNLNQDGLNNTTP